jgi:hypothetical protein
LSVVPERILATQRGGARVTVVLAVDGLGWSAADGLGAHDLVPLTTTFPSTSVVAWVTAVSGLGASEHGIPGPVYRHPSVPPGRVWNMFREKHYGFDEDWSSGGAPTRDVALGPWPTSFEALAREGIGSRVHLGDLSTMQGAWTSALTRGATTVLAPQADWERIRLAPRAIAEVTVGEVDRSIAATRGAPCVVWIHVNLDEYAHFHGYDAEIAAAVRALGVAAARWSDRGAAVLLHSDHGQVETTCSPRLADAWRRVESPAFTDGPAGGAGRVRWLHTVKGRREEARRILEGAEAPGLVVRYREELSMLPESLPLGDLVVIGTGREFPVADPTYRFEHGSLTAEEMVVPLATWDPG